MGQLARAASIIVGKEQFMNVPSTEVPELKDAKGSPLTYGWVILVNLFTRELLCSLAIASFADNPPV